MFVLPYHIKFEISRTVTLRLPYRLNSFRNPTNLLRNQVINFKTQEVYTIPESRQNRFEMLLQEEEVFPKSWTLDRYFYFRVSKRKRGVQILGRSL